MVEINNRTDCGITRREQLENDLRQLILSGGLDPKRPISTETELAETYALSRTTVRKALRTLTREGLLRTVRGVGSFSLAPEQLETTKKKRKLLALLPEYAGNPAAAELYNRRLISGLADYSFVHGVTLELRSHREPEAGLIAEFQSGEIAGIVWERPASNFNPVIETLHGAGIPQVTISRRVPGVPAIFFDYEDGIREAVNFLYSIGHREIAFLDLAVQEEIFTRRQACFAEELARHGVKDSETFIYPFRFKALDDATLDRIRADHPKLTAMIVSVAHFKQLYPEKAEQLKPFSLLAFGESDYTRNIPGLSLLREPRHQIGFRAAELIFEPPQDAGSTAIYLSGELSIGKSCRSPE